MGNVLICNHLFTLYLSLKFFFLFFPRLKNVPLKETTVTSMPFVLTCFCAIFGSGPLAFSAGDQQRFDLKAQLVRLKEYIDYLVCREEKRSELKEINELK